MNYIRHLNNFLCRAAADPHMTAGHISLYMAIFRQWNAVHFKNCFPADRKLLMRNSKIGSKDTYTKYLKELHAGGYIRYHSPLMRYLPPKITVHRLDHYHDDAALRQRQLFTPTATGNDGPKNGTGPVPDSDEASPEPGTATVPDQGRFYKQTNTKQENSVLGTPTRTEVEIFFRQQGYAELEAKKFWYYNESKNWQLADGSKIKQWEPLAHKWMLNDNAANENNTPGGNNATDREKNYDEPL